MTDADRPAFDALMLQLEQHYQWPEPGPCRLTGKSFEEKVADLRAFYFDVLRDLSLADVAAAIRWHVEPPWPPPGVLLRAHRERVESDNHKATWALFTELSHQPPSERRDALLTALGF